MKNEAKSFIVRIWIESNHVDGDSPTWRGVIEHVGSSEHKNFHELKTVTQFISEKTGLVQPTSAIDWWQTTKNWFRDELRKRLPNLH